MKTTGETSLNFEDKQQLCKLVRNLIGLCVHENEMRVYLYRAKTVTDKKKYRYRLERLHKDIEENEMSIKKIINYPLYFVPLHLKGIEPTIPLLP